MSFRGRILTVVIAASVVPLALVGLWLTAGTVRSGDRFLNQRLHGALDATVSLVATEWVQLRSALLFLGDHATVQQVLNDEGTSVPAPARGDLDRRFNALDPAVRSVRILDRGGTEVWGMRRRAEAVTASSRDVLAEYGTVHQSVPIHERLGGERIGSLQVTLDPSVLLPPAQLPAITAGMVLALANADGGLATPTPFEATMLAEDRFVWAGDEWTTGRRVLEQPAVTVIVAATLGPFVASFQSTARRGVLALTLVAVFVLVATVALTNRLTRSLGDLADATEAVAGGDLERTIPETGGDEVGAVGRAFNTMTGRLRTTLGQLAGQESLASVGEFAAGLAHEVRNPLTAVQVDLQYVEAQLPVDSPLREPQAEALAEIRRLDATVRDALRVARSGRVERREIDARGPLRAAVRAAMPLVEERRASLSYEEPALPMSIQGDANALEQLFLNLLVNAARAVNEDGHVAVGVRCDANELHVTIRDDGDGMSEDVRRRAFEPLFSTSGDGTGLGLPISRRIAVAHGGDVHIESSPGEGTTVVVRISRLGPGGGGPRDGASGS